MAKYFGTNGARGIFGKDFTVELAKRIARGIGLYFNSGKILLARDGRVSSEALRNAAVEELLEIGAEVVDLGQASSPTAEFMVKKLKAAGLIIITASHNPPEWNGMKVVDGNGIAVSRERAEKIEQLMDAKAAASKKGKLVIYEGANEAHIKEIMSHLNTEKIKKRKPKLVLDCGNGMASLIAPVLFKHLGCEVIPINSNVDGRFPGRPSEPTEANVADMLALVKETKADMGIAWDGDADRVAFADENGCYVIGDKVFALSALLKVNGLKERKAAIVTTVATSLAIEDIAKKFGVKVIHTKIGAPYLSEEVAKGNVAIAGEEVGGVIWPEISLAKEGIYTAAKIVEAICDKQLSSLLKELPVYCNVKEKIPADEKKKREIVEKAKRYAQANKLDFVDIDGVRINFDSSWVIVRAAGTENYVRIFAEAKTEREAKEIIEKYKKIVLG